MSRLSLFSIFAVLVFLAPVLSVQAMTLERMDEIIREHAANVAHTEDPKASPQVWEFDYFGVRMACISDPSHNRMRLIVQVAEVGEMKTEHFRKVLDANFHSSLDARYATSHGILYSAFLHPLSTLSDSQLQSAMLQVATLARTFGSGYTSGALRYGDPGVEM